MNPVSVYQCLCDETRLRILNLLLDGPLCVCHLTEVLGVSQPKVSRHLKALRAAGALETERCHNWTICRIPETRGSLLDANLKCLQDLRVEQKQFSVDLKKRRKVLESLSRGGENDLPGPIRCLAEGCPPAFREGTA